MSLLGIDIAWDRPTIAEIKKTGAQWVARYFSTDPIKDLTAQEVQDYPANGLSIVVVYETTTNRAGQGKQAGVDDAHNAIAERSRVGLPANMPIHFAVDEDISWAGVEAYFQGVVSVLGYALTGVYGGLHVIDGAHSFGLKYLWQASAWSGGVWSQYATIRQPLGTTLNGGADYDDAEVPDFGQFPRPTPGAVDMPLTAADVELILNTKMPAFAEVPGPGGKPYIPTVAEVLNGAKTADAQLDALKTELDGVKSAISGVTALKLTDAQIAALVTQIVPVLIPQLVTALGKQLDGSK